MKALVLAAGRGSRLDARPGAGNKCMRVVGGKPLLQRNLEIAAACGVEEIVLVVGFRAEEIEGHFGSALNGTPIRYVLQKEQHGLVHAIECAADAVDGQDFMLFLGDEMFLRPRHVAMRERFMKGDVFALCGMLTVADKELVRKTYTVLHNEKQIIRLVEKPRTPLNHLQGTGSCIFRNEILDFIQYTPIHHLRHEKELPDLVQCAIDNGMRVEMFDIADRYANINTHDDISGVDFFDEEEMV